jgi:hypothetical protein
MPSYRYYTADLLSGDILGDLDFYGVYATKQINRAGNFTASMKLTGNPVHDEHRLACSMPGRTGVFMERNGELIWGGVLWSRMWSTQGKTLQFSARTFESVFERFVLETHFIQQKVAQELVLENLLNQIQAQENCDLGITIDSLPTTNRDRTVLIPDYEFHFAQDALQQLIDVDEGLEISIDVLPGAIQDRPEKVMRVGYPQLGEPNAELFFEFPGSITDYWVPESATEGGVKFATLGYGSGNKVARATAVVQDLLDAGWPAWWIVKQYPTIADVGILQDKVMQESVVSRVPKATPTFDLHPDNATFTGWNNLGDEFTVNIEDFRYPNGFQINSRMIGWELTPQSADSPELLKLIIEGADLV